MTGVFDTRSRILYVHLRFESSVVNCQPLFHLLDEDEDYSRQMGTRTIYGLAGIIHIQSNLMFALE